ncbi:MAG: AhpC/TSA family protein [Sphingomonadales bacterium]|nr:AhpC/TSA family protein [Sphingomonadales bacterium]
MAWWVKAMSDNTLTLAQQISDFTAAAEQRLPADYLAAFRALVADLEDQGIGQAGPAVGDSFPDFALTDHTGHRIQASARWNERTLMLKFYRGGWCPYCNLELAALMRHADDFAALGVEVLAIAPERPELLDQTREKSAPGFTFLWDEGNGLARKLGIAFDVDARVKAIYKQIGIDLQAANGSWVLPVPATFVVSAGRVLYRFVDPNYLVRQDPAHLLQELRSRLPLDKRT